MIPINLDHWHFPLIAGAADHNEERGSLIKPG